MRVSCSAVRPGHSLRCLAAAAVGRPRPASAAASVSAAVAASAARPGPAVRLRPSLAGGRLGRSPAHAISARRAPAVIRAWGEPVEWQPATVVENTPAATNLTRIVLDVGDRAAGYTKPGQYIQVRASGPDAKPGFFAVASPPATAGGADAKQPPSTLELLIRSGVGTAADALAATPPGSTVDASPVQGGGFPVDRIPPTSVDTVLLFATGSGIAPIAALIESGALQAGKRRDVRLYYGTANKEATAFADRAGAWADAHGVRTINVFSDDGDDYVQDVFAKSGGLADAGRTAAVLCGQREMCDAVKALLGEAGVPAEAVLLNF